MIISAFPCTGKSYLCNGSHNKIIANGMPFHDSDSSKFSWTYKNDVKVRDINFPYNYLEHIRKLRDSNVLVSTHSDIRKALAEECMPYYLVYPEWRLKEEYKKRAFRRGSDMNFIETMDHNWDIWMESIHNDLYGIKLKLKSGEYLSDLF